MSNFEKAKSVAITPTVKGRYDVIVVGGGISGVCASVAAARQGMSVLLMEKSVNLGGLATSGLISWYEPLCNGMGKKVMSGLAEELIKLSVSCGFDNLPASWGGKSQNPPRNDRYSTFYSPTFFTLALDKFVTDNGVKLLFDILATYPLMENGRCKGIIGETVAGSELYESSIIIDCTGNATIMKRAGVPCRDGKNFLTYIVHEMDTVSAEQYAKDKDLAKFRRWKNCGADYMGNGHPRELRLFCGDSAEDITEFMLEGKLRMLEKYDNTDKNSREIFTVPSMPQFRTVRNICGESDFDGDENRTELADSIGTVGDFRCVQKTYNIPYSALYNKDFDNLLAAGRIISVKDFNAWEIARVIPVCALTGEAAGIAAALAIRNSCAVSDIDVKKLQDKLSES